MSYIYVIENFFPKQISRVSMSLLFILYFYYILDINIFIYPFPGAKLRDQIKYKDLFSYRIFSKNLSLSLLTRNKSLHCDKGYFGVQPSRSIFGCRCPNLEKRGCGRLHFGPIKYELLCSSRSFLNTLLKNN